MQKERRIVSIPRVALTLPVLLLIFFVFRNWFYNSAQIDYVFYSLDQNEVSEIVDVTDDDHILEMLEENYLENNFAIQSGYSIYDVGLNLDSKSLNEYSEEVIDFSDEDDIYNNLTSEEINEIYNILLSKKIL